jgi:hypothetical protein
LEKPLLGVKNFTQLPSLFGYRTQIAAATRDYLVSRLRDLAALGAWWPAGYNPCVIPF